MHGKAILVTLAAVTAAMATTFYVDPQNGSADGDGSPARPWLSLRQVVDGNLIATQQWSTYPYVAPGVLQARNATAPVKAGDTLLLRSGCHDSVLIQRAYNADWITIAAQPGHHPVLRNIRFTAAQKWRLQGVTVSPEACGTFRELTLVQVESHNYSGPARYIEVEACTLYSVWNSAVWTIDDWNNRCSDGLSSSGRHITFRNNYLRNVNFGISMSDDSCQVIGNTVENFAGDGLRGVANDLLFQGNTVMNCYDVNANHDDGFQSWADSGGTVGQGAVYRVSLIGNRIIGYTDVGQPFRGTLQGIGCFDGFYDGWVIENNVIVTDHWHGITLLGARNCRIVNNTVCDLNDTSPGPPWISIGDHKNTSPSSNCIVRNNLTTDLNVTARPTVTVDHNIELRDPDLYFVDHAARDMRLIANCPAIDSGSATSAPSTDIRGVPRPQGTGIDIGAYEYTPVAVRQVRAKAVGIPVLRARVTRGVLVVDGDMAEDAVLTVVTADGRSVTRAALAQGSGWRVPLSELPLGVLTVWVTSAHRKSAVAAVNTR